MKDEKEKERVAKRKKKRKGKRARARARQLNLEPVYVNESSGSNGLVSTTLHTCFVGDRERILMAKVKVSINSRTLAARKLCKWLTWLAIFHYQISLH